MENLDPIAIVLSNKSRDLWSTEPDATVYEAIQLMADKGIGALLVMKGDSLVGIFSERDYMNEVILKGKSSKTTHVREIMSSDVITISPHDSVVHGMHKMTREKVRHLPVVEGGKVVGILSIGDLVKWIISAQDTLIHQLEDYIKGTYPA
ncbi:MAG: CBS domain-containing protein [Roseibacillus sp.]